MEVEATQDVLARAEGPLFLGAVLVAFIILQLSHALLLVLLLLCAAAGLLCAYCLFRCIPRLPNILFHIQHPSRIPSVPKTKLLPPQKCAVCSQSNCERHHTAKRKEYLNPWDDLCLPKSVDRGLTEILELVMQRFVYTWHRSLAPAAESMEDEIRTTIRHASAVLLRRAQKVDLPRLITAKLLQAVAAHIHIYVRARERLPIDASVAAIENAVTKEYRDHTHSAMRGTTGNIRYFRSVARSLLPLLLPEHILQSKIMCNLVEELFASKVFVPAMNFTAKPDFINRLLLTAFDKNSRLEPVFGPVSSDVPFLAQWACARSRRYQSLCPLDIPLPELLDPQHHLYVFMQYMKAQENIYILQVYLTLSDLKQKVGALEENQAPAIINQVQNLYDTYLLPSSLSYLQLDHTQVANMAAVLAGDSPPTKKCEELKQLNVFGRLRGYIYTELMMKIYYPQFLHSYQFYNLYIKQDKPSSEEGGKSSKGHRWRQKTRYMKKLSQPSVASEQEAASDSAVNGKDVADSAAMSRLAPKSVQIVDAESHMEGIRPYTLYVIMSQREGEGETDMRYQVVRRRYKEFVGLDTKLRQFLGEAAYNIQLPSKRAFRNMEKAFIETRCRELDQYLVTLITYPRIGDSQILASFLSQDSDPSLFMPDSMTGKVLKAVPSMLIKKDRTQHVEELLQTMSQVVEPAGTLPSTETVAQVTAISETHRESRDRYLEDAAEDMSKTELTRHKPWLHHFPSKEPVHMRCIMDLVLFVAQSVYHASPLQLTALMMAKLLGEDTVEALVHRFVSRKVELMLTEAHVLRLLALFRDNLFFSTDPPRKEDEIRQRFQEAFDQLLHYPPPLVVAAIGKQRYLEGTAMILEGLQCRELNKQLFFKLLDIILLELFPELGVEGEGGAEG